MGFGIQLVGLDLADIDPPLTDDLFLHVFGMLPGFVLPVGDGTLIQLKGRDERRNGATVRQQAQDNQYQPDRMFEAIQHGAGCLGKRPMTGMTNVAPFFVRMDANRVACATIGLGAYYQLRAHGCWDVFGHTSQ